MPDLFSDAVPELLERHFDHLHCGSGIAVDVIRERGYRSVLGSAELAALGFGPSQRRVPGLLIPVCPPDGGHRLFCYRPDLPRTDRGGKPIKYELPVGATMRLDVPPRCRPQLSDPSVPLWVTEGIKKADALASHGLCASALLGVWGFLGKDTTGSVKLLADFDLIAWNGRTVNVVFDSDVMTRPEVRQALDRLGEHLRRKGATVQAVYLPGGPNGEKVGVDEYLLTRDIDDLQALVGQSRPALKPAAPVVELLDEAPPAISRPLQLVDGHGYAVTWLWTRTIARETLDPKTGDILRHDPPIERVEPRLFVVRDDGTVLGDGADQPLSALGLEVALDSPPEDLLWRAPSVKRYRGGHRPDPAEVFERLVRAYDYFLDFSWSVGDQLAMGRLSACLSLMTWFSDAFTVMPYPWANGEWGSGKTKWLTVWAETSFLGRLVTWGGTFAALRDLADWGATLAFDDAENVDDPKADPDKRALLLAGNRKGAVVPLKELAPDGKRWRIRWVNAYCPRGFSAKRRPTGALEQRVILIPLVRTSDPLKGNRDPADLHRWPIDARQLRDDLWSTAVTLLPEAARVWAGLDNEMGLVGRRFEPWRAPLAVARLFERHGVVGLEATVRQVMAAALAEASQGDRFDLTRLVLAALCRMAGDVSDVHGVGDVKSAIPFALTFKTSELTTCAKALAEELEVDMSSDQITERRVGRVLSLLRFEKERDAKLRGWRVPLAALSDLARAHGVTLDGFGMAPQEINVTDVTNVITSSLSDETAEWTF